jgi:hypothetical protein
MKIKPDPWLPKGVSAADWRELLGRAQQLDCNDAMAVYGLLHDLHNPAVYSTAQTAEYLAVKPATVHKYVQRGRLVPINPGCKPLLFSIGDVEKLGEENAARGAGDEHPNSHERQRRDAYVSAHGEEPV